MKSAACQFQTWPFRTIIFLTFPALPPNLIVQGSQQEQKQGQEGALKEQEWRPKGEKLSFFYRKIPDSSFVQGSGPEQEQQQGRPAPAPQLRPLRVS